MYVIIGANGYLGSYFIKNILQYSTEQIIAVARHKGQFYRERVEWVECNITDFKAVETFNSQYLKKNANNKILFLAAYHNPDLVEQNPKLAWNTNVTALSNFLNIADNVKRLFYPSTDSVYGNGDIKYKFKETDVLFPVNRYGLHKTVAEKLVTAYGYNVVRYPFLIAPSLIPEKKHFYDVIAESLLAEEKVDMLADSYRSTLSFDTVSRLTIELMEREDDVPQILNVCGDKAYSKYDVGLMIADKLRVSRDLIVPISMADSKAFFTTKRASSTVMDNSLLKSILGYESIDFEI